MSILTEREDDQLEIEGIGTYRVTCTFDRVLQWLGFLKGEHSSEEILQWSYSHFIEHPPDLPSEDRLLIVQSIVDQHINPYQNSSGDQVDETIPQPQYYDLVADADLIYASFLQDYQIDLTKEIGRMSWHRFIALLNGLRDDTKFKQVVSIRQEPLPTGNDRETIQARQSLLELKEIYALDTPENETYEQYKLTQSFINLRQKAKGMRT
ncbi:MAG: Gp15 family bacteriophage protein [Sporolactobacillus sp.]